MGDWLIASVGTSGRFYNYEYHNCTKTEAIKTFNREHQYQVLLNIIEL